MLFLRVFLIGAAFIAGAVPALVYAAPSDFKELVGLILSIINITVVPLIFALAFLVFIWGIAQYLLFSGSEEKKTQGKQLIVWGIVAFFIMISVWGIVNLINSAFFDPFGTAQERCVLNPGLFGCGGP